jgi:hypothetical protein
LEVRFFWTMQPKSMGKPWLHVVARIVVAFLEGALQRFEARQVGHSSICVGILNCDTPLTMRCISNKWRKLITMRHCVIARKFKKEIKTNYWVITAWWPYGRHSVTTSASYFREGLLLFQLECNFSFGCRSVVHPEIACDYCLTSLFRFLK